MVKHRITFALSILLQPTVYYPHTSTSLTAVPTEQRYKQNNKPQQQFSYHSIYLQATFVTMPSDSEEPKQKKVKTDESAAAAAKSKGDVSVDVQRNDDGTYIICFESIAICNAIFQYMYFVYNSYYRRRIL